MIPRVYIAGKYSAETRMSRVANTFDALQVGRLVHKLGCDPIIPHIRGIELEDIGQSYEWWIEATLRELRTCDACVMVPGWRDSRGSVGEHADCVRNWRPVFEAWKDGAGRVFLPDGFLEWVAQKVTR